MKKIALLGAFALLVAAGCSNTVRLAKTAQDATQCDVFQELTEKSPLPKGYADLRIVSSLKTHSAGMYSSNDPHGTPDYRLLLNVDGQVMNIQGKICEEGDGAAKDPEAGLGARYTYRATVRLPAGRHKVIVALPAEKLAAEEDVVLEEGTRSSLVVEPVYRRGDVRPRPGFYDVTSFKAGIKSLRLVLNGTEL